ncbi:DUF2953 domain-containing protein [Ferviditalea candida]|uniref:DUF2953 domain-containing protein n=1 Tax=Ferviditalea candida TaxID=3108399 RepID=A0ABU5ZJT9_9BACL|nr:DUF2953 domain-containing protein [Paenibacillaceae bacterium T2]
MYWIVSLGLLAVLIVLIWMSRITIKLFFSREQDNDRLYADFRGLFGLARFRFEVPAIRFKNLQKGVRLQNESAWHAGKETMSEEKGKQRINREKIIRYYREFKMLADHVFDLHGWIKDVLVKVKCTSLRWQTFIGLEDAADTAVTAGLIWGLKASILGFASKYFCMKETPEFAVIPQFTQFRFSTELQCIFEFRLGVAIQAGLILLVRIMKVKGGLKTWQNILFKA